MDDVLKLAEEALNEALKLDPTCDHANTLRGGSIWTFCDDCGKEWADDRGGFRPDPPNETIGTVLAALAAIRAARAECGWRPIAEMEVVEDNGVTLGMWRNGAWVTTPEVWYRSWAVDHGFTHFHRPQLPTPPQEADHGA